jgi:hypothetical protein
MVIVQYYKSPDDDDNYNENRDDKKDASPEVVDKKKEVEPSSTIGVGSVGVSVTKKRFEGLDNLISFLFMNRSSLSIKEVFKNGIILCFVFSFGVLSRDRLKSVPLSSFNSMTQITSNRDSPGFALPSFKKDKRILNMSDVKKIKELQPVENKYYDGISPEDKSVFFGCLDKLCSEYVQTINIGPRFSINYRTYLGFQIVYNKKTTGFSMSDQFDSTVQENNNGEGGGSEQTILPVLTGVVQELINNWPHVKKNFEVKPVLMLGFSLDYRIK